MEAAAEASALERLEKFDSECADIGGQIKVVSTELSSGPVYTRERIFCSGRGPARMCDVIPAVCEVGATAAIKHACVCD